MTLMFQREVAERIIATPGSKSYGRLAVLAGWRSDARILFNIPATAFTPPPKVMSSVVGFVPKPSPLPVDASLLERVVAAAFGQRRKMLRQSLKLLGADPLPLLEAAGIAPTQRAEEIGVAGFVALANAFAQRQDAGNFDAALMAQATDPTPATTRQNWATSGIPPAGQNNTRYSNPRVDALLEQPDLAHALEVRPHGVGMQLERTGDVSRGQRPRRPGELEVDGVAGVVTERLEDLEPRRGVARCLARLVARTTTGHPPTLHGRTR